MKKLILAVLFISQSVLAQTWFGPQVPAAKGPWFEGWYMRITDHKRHTSVAVIATSQLLPQERFIPGMGSSGYVAILTQNGEGQVTQSFEAYPEKTFVTIDGQDQDLKPRDSNSDFRWEAPGHGWLGPNGFDLSIGDEVKASAQIDPNTKKAWSPHWDQWGPAGFGTFFKFVPLQWFVESLSSFANYFIEFRDSDNQLVSVKSTGETHIEKNWGKTFPKAWMWLQAVDPDTKDAVALAGGILSLGPLDVKTYLAGYKSSKVNAEFHLGQMFDLAYVDSIDACKGEFRIQIENGQYKMILKAKADPKTFAYVSIPTREGYQPQGGVESFSADIEMEIHNTNWVRDLSSKSSLIEKKRFKKAALEFGAGYMKCAK